MKQALLSLLGFLLIAIIGGINYYSYVDLRKINCPPLFQNKDDMIMLFGSAYETALEPENSRRVSISIMRGLMEIVNVQNMFESIRKCPSIDAVRMVYGFIGNGVYYHKNGNATLSDNGEYEFFMSLDEMPKKIQNQIKDLFTYIDKFTKDDNESARDLVQMLYINLVRLDYTKNRSIDITKSYIKDVTS